MRTMSRVAACAMAWAALTAAQAGAQTADDIVEKHLAAMGGRAALTKLESRIATGTMTIAMQGMQFTGPVEIYAKRPNKGRMMARIDLSTAGAGEVVIDNRCDGKTAWLGNSMQGGREATGSQLQAMLNAAFPTPLLDYKQSGGKIELTGKDKVGDRAAYVIVYTPKTGAPAKQYFDAETYHLLRTVMTIDVPELGGASEQTTDTSDYRDVDGVKVPFSVVVVNSMQTVTISLTKVEHNKPIDEAMFVKPAGQ